MITFSGANLFNTATGNKILIHIMDNQPRLRSPDSILAMDLTFRHIINSFIPDFHKNFNENKENRDKLAKASLEIIRRTTKDYTAEQWKKFSNDIVKNKVVHWKHICFIQHFVNYVCNFRENDKKISLTRESEKTYEYKVKKIEEDVDVIPTEVLDKMFLNAKPFLQTAIAFFLCTGARIGIFKNLKREDIDIDQGVVKVIEKGNKETRFSVPKKILERIINEPKFFRGERTECNIRRNITTFGTKLGIHKSYLHPHAFRHTYATLLLKKDYPIEVISQLLGHGSVSLTAKVYARETIAEKQTRHLPWLPKPVVIDPIVWQWVEGKYELEE